MPTISASDVRRLHTPVMEVPIPGDRSGAAFLVRLPDVPTMLANGWLPVPLTNSAVEASAVSHEPVRWVIEEEGGRDVAQDLDRWICACALLPRIVMAVEDANHDALHIDELEDEIKLAIIRVTRGALRMRMQSLRAQFEAFVVDDHTALVLDATARRYGQRPSTLAGISTPDAALDFDFAIAVRGAAAERPLPRSRFGVH